MRFLRLSFFLLIFSMILFSAFFGCDDDSGNSSGSDSTTEDDDDDSADDDDDVTDDDFDDDDDSTDDDDDDETDIAGYVDPFIGTSGDYGQLHPAAAVPFGMVKLGPDTVLAGHAGYDYRSNNLRGFSHTRIGGVGCTGAGGSLRMLPFAGDTAPLFLTMDKSSEIASAGYYATRLSGQQGISAELTATRGVGMHRYTFDQGGEVSVRVILDAPFASHHGSAWAVNGGRLEGWVSAANVCNKGSYTFYFSIQFDHTFQVKEASADNPILNFDLGEGKVLSAKVALSSVDENQAAQDGQAEWPDWDFDNAAAQARAAWNDYLGRLKVTGDEEHKTLFYTLLYRSSLFPAQLSGPTGEYRGTDGQKYTAQGYNRYQGWSLWDTYRTKYPLLSIIDRERTADFMRSLVDLYIQGKADWATDYEPCPTVRTEHAVALLADAINKGIEDFGIEDAYDEILLEGQTLPTNTPDTILEASFDHWAMAQIADYTGDTVNRDSLLAQSAQYESDWIDNFQTLGADADIVHARGLYEGTLWQYRWAVPHDLYGIVDLAGGQQDFTDQLDQFFDEELYNQGNEPDIHAPFLYHFVGQPWKTQALVHALLTQPVNQWYGTHDKWFAPYYGRIYNAAPKGYFPEMDDDVGTMAAWFVMGAMGLYQVTVGQPVFMLSSPIFEEVTIAVVDAKGDENEFQIVAEGISETNFYILSATLNGAALDRAWLTYEEITAGGELVLTMGSAPNESWGSGESTLPPAPFPATKR